MFVDAGGASATAGILAAAPMTVVVTAAMIYARQLCCAYAQADDLKPIKLLVLHVAVS